MDPTGAQQNLMRKGTEPENEAVVEKQIDSIAMMKESIKQNQRQESVRSTSSSRSAARKNQKGFGEIVSPLKKPLAIEIPKDENEQPEKEFKEPEKKEPETKMEVESAAAAPITQEILQEAV